MNAILKSALAMAAVAVSAQAAAEITYYEREGFAGRSFTARNQVSNLESISFYGRASSAVVTGNRWEVCEDTRFNGRCVVLRPGRYSSLAAMGLNDRIASVQAVSADAVISEYSYAPAPVADSGYAPAPVAGSDAVAEVVFYESEGFEGRSFTTKRQVRDFQRSGFNDRASSVVVLGDRWEVCENVQFGGRCVVLRPGRYSSLVAMGLNDRVSSVRAVSRDARVDDNRYAPDPDPVYDNRRRGRERLYQANVTSSRAVVATPEQRCWMEKEQVPQEKSKISIPGAVVGAVIGGILGHQVGSGRGTDVATIGGAVAGGAVGSQVGRIGGAQQPQTRDVQRCENVTSQTLPSYWDVTYDFRGQEHRIQMTTQPGATVTVNERGEPRA
jgi:uncharacterized protein YcfJ